ncbi:DUF4209 domain-containing protein [Asanoa sp. NPDC049518]|uniref:DUF4209 domain-containing protein n=1 Tax=unclassified Asanoa TaxID=2685164 RepID=UPI00342A540C
MTSADVNEGIGQESIDPSWWSEGLTDDEDVPRSHKDPVLLSGRLTELKAKAQEEFGEDSLRTRVLDVLAKATSPMLVPDNWGQPYAPAMQIGGRRTIVPEDLNAAELEVLALLVPLIEQPFLRARVADIAWTYGNRRDMELLREAVNSYRAAPLEASSWYGGGGDGLRRALELSLRRGKPGRVAVDEMAAELVKFLLTSDATAKFMATHVSDLLTETRSIDKAGARSLGDHFVSLAGTVTGDHRLKRAYLRTARGWLARAGEAELANECLERIARAYVDEADDRLADEGGGLVAGTLVEKAIAVIRALPRAYRSAHGLDDELQQLRRRLGDARELSLEEMHSIESDSVDISLYVERAQKSVTGKERIEALGTLATIAPLIDPATALADARERMQQSISRLFRSSTFSADGRKIAARDGSADVSDEAAFDEVVRWFPWRIELTVEALIRPALELIVFEHHFDFGFIAEICAESPVVPQGHTNLWARGLWHGLSGDLPSAISLLVPQVEQLVRANLQAHGAFTLFVDESGVESEKSLNALLEMPESQRVLGPSLTFELRALLCEQLGPNLRNDLAHGLLNDPRSWSSAATYAWWLCLRMVLLPYLHVFSQAKGEQASTDGPQTVGTRPDSNTS